MRARRGAYAMPAFESLVNALGCTREKRCVDTFVHDVDGTSGTRKRTPCRQMIRAGYAIDEESVGARR